MPCTCETRGYCLPCDVFRRREYSRSGPTPPTSSAWSLDEGSGRDLETLDDLEEDCYA